MVHGLIILIPIPKKKLPHNDEQKEAIISMCPYVLQLKFAANAISSFYLTTPWHQNMVFYSSQYVQILHTINETKLWVKMFAVAAVESCSVVVDDAIDVYH